ncbi:bifunctional acetate--CoA ligase family protein/GNAT family N-acetyltransferase [Pararhodospirillum photometricum]|uniref:N-acetyltransferase n=1 Tax=Pararhodospirillum photometricum DSM 122 TaxID=1150469 RepID=H6SMP3_PARPM|nr:bifunctional acetate--CoA ligase family protein/GNAT family N-acetyltransferase [Pararhodospirillum photometricum]CCG09178.1 N-acetyltransferase [Pararhodospirillum photometricum DSM 122]
MSVRHLSSLFAPSSVAVLGASNQADTVGHLVMRNLLSGGFAGPIMPVNPQYQAVAGVLAYPDVASLPVTPDLALLCSPPQHLAAQIKALGQRGTRAAIVMTDVRGHMPAQGPRPLSEILLALAREHRMRMLGPGSLGLLAPGIGLNASGFVRPAAEGKVAFVSQSGAVCTAVLDWARGHGIGFSHFLSLGEKVDVDFGDAIDYLGTQPDVRAVLLHIESVTDARKFMSAARSAARNKPVIVIKSGRGAEGAQAAASHTGNLAGADAIHDIAFKRAGMLRVYSLEELFNAVETLAHTRRPTRGHRLAIVTNGGGLGVMAVDELIERGGTLAPLSPATTKALAQVLPPGVMPANPLDLGGAAGGELYGKALDILLGAGEIDAVLVMYAPFAQSPSTEIAQTVIDTANRHRTASVFTCWVGQAQVVAARSLFTEAQIPTYLTPDEAIQGFMHLVTYRRNQHMLMETPPSLPSEFTANVESARQIIDLAIARGHLVMSEPEAKAVFASYGIPTVETHIARTPDEAAAVARRMNGSVALKILSRAITHKSDVGGVVLDLETPDDVRRAAEDMAQRVAQTFPDAPLEGFTVQRMARRPGAHELIVGATLDPIFGPVVLFGQGGTAVEIIRDQAVALPPLNMALARDMLERTRVFRLLEGYRDKPAADLESICLTLIQIAQMMIDIPEIVELEINPLFADARGVLAVDARVRLEPGKTKGPHRLAIRPYPAQLEETFVMRDGRAALLRPIRPEDEPKHYEFVSRLSPEDVRFRFFGLVKELPHDQMARLTQIDYAREMAFIAQIEEDDEPRTLGVVRAVTDPDNETTEFSVVVRSDLKGSGLGKALMLKIIRYCYERRTRYMVGQVLRDNRRMLRFCEDLGFERIGLVDEDVVELRLDLRRVAALGD